MTKYETIGNMIRKFERENPDQAMVVVINSSPASELRQINSKGKQRWGDDTGYTSAKVRDLKGDASLWKLIKTA